MNSWPRVPVSDLCSLIVDCVNKTAPSVDQETPYKMIRTTNIKNGRIDLTGCRSVSGDTFDKWTKRAKVLRGDILLTREAPMGEVGRVNFDESVFLGQRVVQYRTNPEKLTSEYLLYSFLSPDLQYQFRRHDSSGSTVSHIRVPDCLKFEIPLPTLGEQKKIAAILSALDAKIDCNNRINAELEAMAKTLYDYWFVQFDFPDANGKPYKSSGGKMDYNATLKREIPAGWETIRLNELFQNRTDSIAASKVDSESSYTPIDVLPMKKMSFGVGQPSYEANSSLIQYKANDILIGAMRVYFHRVCVAPFDGITRTTVIVLRPKEPNHLPFLYQVCNEDRTINIASKISVGTQQPYVNWENALENHKIPYPENGALVQKYSSMMLSITKDVINREKENAELGRLRDWLLPLLMNGQVTVA